MARTKHQISDSQIQKIKKNLKSVCSTPIEFPADCNQLATQIFQVTNSYISETTLKRFFGFIASDFSPAYETIRTIERFIQLKQNNQPSVSTEFVLSFYSPSHFENLDSGDTSFQAACRSIAIELKNNPALFESVMVPLAQSKMGQQFYYELFPDYSILSEFQFKGYEYFLEYANYYEGQIYGRCVLFMKHFFDQNIKAMEKMVHEVMHRYVPRKKLHPFVRGRVFQVQLILAAQQKEKKNDQLLVEMWKTERKMPRQAAGNFLEFPGFHYFCCDGLYHAQYWDELLQMSRIALQDFTRHKQFEWKGYYNQFLIYQCLALVHLKQQKKALRLFGQIKNTEFYFITKEYYLGLYNLLGVILKSEILE